MHSKLNQATKLYAIQISPINALAVTLTMKQFCKDYLYLDDIKCHTNFRHFINRVNYKLFGKRFKRFGKSLKVFSSLEKKDRWHFHIAIEHPTNISTESFKALIIDSWGKTHYGYKQIKIKPVINIGWADYITKFANRLDEIDWENCT